MDLFEDEAVPGNAPEFTVSELSGAVKRTVEGAFGHVRVRGEVGRVSRPRSGHIYLDLKDENACLAGVVWRSAAARLETLPEEGMEVIATGRLTTFPGQSKYQIVIESIAPAGLGALMAMLEKRRQALAAEGLFGAERKRPLPFLPEVIGVVTSPSGAVIRDILHRLHDRFPRHVLVWPVAVQGPACAPEVARAIRGFNALPVEGPIPRPDILIVARGGGSVEDLWGFNEEEVVRAAADSRIPLISAVGHETDTTLIDHAADRRAPTPTAAAEMAVPVRRELMVAVGERGARLARALNQGVTSRDQRLRDLGRALPRPEALMAGPRQRLDWLSGRLGGALRQGAELRRSSLREAAAVLRPATLRARTAEARRHLDRAARGLTPEAMQRTNDERRRRLSDRTRVLQATAVTRFAQQRRQEYERRTARFVAALVEESLRARRETLGQCADRAEAAARHRLDRLADRLAALNRVRETAGYEATLARGYAVVWSGEHVVTEAEAARAADTLSLQFADGRVEVGGTPARRKPRPKGDAPEQKSLF